MTDEERLDRIVAQARRDQDRRAQDYREQALKLFPWICGRCGREFTRETLSGLTVHHKDHDHDNNPSDGSNWELLCLYCHDNEHMRQVDAARFGTTGARQGQGEAGTYKAFAGLEDLLKEKK